MKHPREILLGAQAAGGQLPVCDHYSGVEARIDVKPSYGLSDEQIARIVDAAIRPDTGLVIVETPANPSLDLVDIADVAGKLKQVPEELRRVAQSLY